MASCVQQFTYRLGLRVAPRLCSVVILIPSKRIYRLKKDVHNITNYCSTLMLEFERENRPQNTYLDGQPAHVHCKRNDELFLLYPKIGSNMIEY